ncbi:unnamed protein product [Arabis nemorensis]|uniref:Uncharacterized protein n=1 Tax=Arabis nemorensis TaxID=586526 RepID=A0A565CIY4_9BRAS|nr:unnamed protein product [Arabis nemorensis]
MIRTTTEAAAVHLLQRGWDLSAVRLTGSLPESQSSAPLVVALCRREQSSLPPPLSSMAFSSAPPCVTIKTLSSPSRTMRCTRLSNFQTLTRPATSNPPDPPVPPDPPPPSTNLKPASEISLSLHREDSIESPPSFTIAGSNFCTDDCGHRVQQYQRRISREASKCLSGTRSETFPAFLRRLIALSLGGFPLRIHL